MTQEARQRLQKYLAGAGLGSRRRCEEIITAGRVTVDGVVAQLGSSVDPELQSVAVDGRPVRTEAKEYWLLNKPRGVLSAAIDPRGRPTVVDMVPAGVRVFPVGRLDLDSTGLIVLTNDGELAVRLLHPRYHVEKEYTVTLRGRVTNASLCRLRGGVDLDDGRTAPARVDVVQRDRPGTPRPITILTVVIHEGRKRQVRRMLEAVGHTVVDLHRRRFADLTDAGLAVGQARPLSSAEVETLWAASLGGSKKPA
jgi:23S rRNA pseudouridine2605 synthase